MSPKLFCQSCTMPIDDPSLRGSEKDGSKSDQYCRYCYKDGAFIDSEMTLEKMKEMCSRQMKKQNLSPVIIAQSMKMLPQLKRWNKDDGKIN